MFFFGWRLCTNPLVVRLWETFPSASLPLVLGSLQENLTRRLKLQKSILGTTPTPREPEQAGLAWPRNLNFLIQGVDQHYCMEAECFCCRFLYLGAGQWDVPETYRCVGWKFQKFRSHKR